MAIITIERAREAIPNFVPADNGVLQDIIAACSDLIERYCARKFAVTSFDEVYDGTGYNSLYTYNYPITQIDRISFNPVAAFQLRNTDTGVSRASFRMDAVSLYLTSVKNGVTTNSTITLSSCPMLSDLQTAVNALGNGWNSLALAPYTTWSTADLRSPQGSFDARWGTPYLRLFSYHLFDFDFNPEIGEVVAPFGFCHGYRNYRLLYSAGFTDGSGASSVPEPIQQACAELTASVYYSRTVNPNLDAETVGLYSYSRTAQSNFGDLSIASTTALAQYRNRRVAKYQV